MLSLRPCRKRAGTSTNAIPQDPARRTRFNDMSILNPRTKTQDLTPYGQHLHHRAFGYSALSMRTRYLPTLPADNLATPPTPNPSPEIPQIENNLHVSHSRLPTYSPTERHALDTNCNRNEFPFPIQPVPENVCNKVLELGVPDEPIDIDIQVPMDKLRRPQCRQLVTPRSHPRSQNSCSYSCQVPPTPLPAGRSSRLPSLTSSQPSSPVSPTTPSTPVTSFHTAANTLKLILMADDLGMSINELEELNEFASAPMSGSSKRAGRVLVRRDIRQRLKGSCRDDKDIPKHWRRECRFGSCRQHGSPEDMWRDINWKSTFSDTSKDDMIGHNEHEDTLSEDEDNESIGFEEHEQSLVLAERSICQTARVAKLTRPAALYMKRSIEKVEPAIGPWEENIWACE